VGRGCGRVRDDVVVMSRSSRRLATSTEARDKLKSMGVTLYSRVNPVYPLPLVVFPPGVFGGCAPSGLPKTLSL